MLFDPDLPSSAQISVTWKCVILMKFTSVYALLICFVNVQRKDLIKSLSYKHTPKHTDNSFHGVQLIYAEVFLWSVSSRNLSGSLTPFSDPSLLRTSLKLALIQRAEVVIPALFIKSCSILTCFVIHRTGKDSRRERFTGSKPGKQSAKRLVLSPCADGQVH